MPRTFHRFVIVGVLASIFVVPLEADSGKTSPWYQRCLVGMEVGPTGAQFGGDPSDVGYAAKFNGKEIVEAQIEAHSEYIVIWAKDSEYAYYDSKTAPKCPGLGDRDVLREVVDAAALHELPVIAYCVVQGNGYPLRHHPEYKMVDVHGKPIDRVCLNSGYLEHVKALTTEMLAYGIEGFHIDMLDLGFGPPHGCWCKACQRLFEEEYGESMPSEIAWDEDWDRMLEFRYNTSARFERELRDHVRSLDPDVSVDFNYHGYPPFSWEVGQRPVQHALIGDFVTAETGVWGFSALGVGLTARFLAATSPQDVYQVAMQRGVRMYHDMTTRPLNDIRWELLTLLSHGAKVTIVDKTPYDGSLDPVAYERIGQAFAEALVKRDHFGHDVVQHVGIYYSSRTRDWYGKDTPSRYQQSFTGLHKALFYEHIPYGVLLDENLNLDAMRRFKIIWLPNAAILSEREGELLRKYVHSGGTLVASGLSGLFDRMGHQRDTCVLADLFGADFVETLASNDNHVRFSAEDSEMSVLFEGITPNWPFLVKGPAAIYQSSTAQTVGELMKPHRTVRQQKGLEGTDWPMSADAPVGPAVFVNEYGDGKAVLLACSPGSAVASEHYISEDRLLIRNVVRYLMPEPEIEIDAPLNVESIVTDDKDNRRIRVHLLGYLSPPNSTPATNRPYILPSLVEDAPMYQASIHIRKPIRDVQALNEGTRLRRTNGNSIQAIVNDVHETIVVTY